jgi:hypothetical protein
VHPKVTPNPSIELTRPGMPDHSAHVKRQALSSMKTYQYKQKASTALIGLAITGAIAFGATRYAIENDKALLINNFLYLSPRLASAFIGFGALAGWLAFGCCAFLAYMAVTTKREIRLLSNRVEAPRGGFSKENVVIPYASIKKVEILANGEAKFLYVHHRNGRLTIVPALLPKKSDLDEIYELLLARIV